MLAKCAESGSFTPELLIGMAVAFVSGIFALKAHELRPEGNVPLLCLLPVGSGNFRARVYSVGENRHSGRRDFFALFRKL